MIAFIITSEYICCCLYSGHTPNKTSTSGIFAEDCRTDCIFYNSPASTNLSGHLLVKNKAKIHAAHHYYIIKNSEITTYSSCISAWFVAQQCRRDSEDCLLRSASFQTIPVSPTLLVAMSIQSGYLMMLTVKAPIAISLSAIGVRGWLFRSISTSSLK